MNPVALLRDPHETNAFAHRCASCGRLLEDTREWGYPGKRHSDHRSEPSHGICPACAAALYPDIRLGLIS